MVKTGQYFAG